MGTSLLGGSVPTRRDTCISSGRFQPVTRSTGVLLSMSAGGATSA
jgi:hypothetical protein